MLVLSSMIANRLLWAGWDGWQEGWPPDERRRVPQQLCAPAAAAAAAPKGRGLRGRDERGVWCVPSGRERAEASVVVGET